MRPDLVIQEQSYLGRQYWVVKDPIALKYYRFEEEEFAILQMLDGRASLEEIQHRFEQQFAPQRIMLQELHQLLGMLHRSALVVSDAPGQGPQLVQRHRERSRRERLAAAGNVLCIRFRGIDPDRSLAWLNRRLGWLFSWPCMSLCLVLALGALLLVTVQFDVFRAKLPAFHEFFGMKNWLWLAVILAITKVIHEFGHGLSCKRFGGECHEMGLMLLVLTPCLYCNVSDSWMLPSKWRRAAIGAAGMYVEIVMASACTFLWWFTQPGLLHFLCLNVMFVCSVSTLLFNANPLLRFDGYYILADVIEIPNLRQKSIHHPPPKIGRLVLGFTRDPRSIFASTASSLLCSLLHCRGRLPMGRRAGNSLVSVSHFRTVRPEGHWANHRAGRRVWFASATALAAGEVLSRSREDRSGEKTTLDRQLGSCRDDCYRRVPGSDPALCAVRIAGRAARGDFGLCGIAGTSSGNLRWSR